MFKVGDKVKIRKNSHYYGEDPDYNPADVIGTVIKVCSHGHFNTDVLWPSGEHNQYNTNDLECGVVSFTRKRSMEFKLVK